MWWRRWSICSPLWPRRWTCACGADWIHGELVTATGRQQKRMILVDDQKVIVKDQVTGSAQAYLHLAPDYEYEEQDGQVLVKAVDGNVICRIIPELSAKLVKAVVINSIISGVTSFKVTRTFLINLPLL